MQRYQSCGNRNMYIYNNQSWRDTEQKMQCRMVFPLWKRCPNSKALCPSGPRLLISVAELDQGTTQGDNIAYPFCNLSWVYSLQYFSLLQFSIFFFILKLNIKEKQKTYQLWTRYYTSYERFRTNLLSFRKLKVVFICIFFVQTNSVINHNNNNNNRNKASENFMLF